MGRPQRWLGLFPRADCKLNVKIVVNGTFPCENNPSATAPPASALQSVDGAKPRVAPSGAHHHNRCLTPTSRFGARLCRAFGALCNLAQAFSRFQGWEMCTRRVATRGSPSYSSPNPGLTVVVSLRSGRIDIGNQGTGRNVPFTLKDQPPIS
jgi:hypothetical protein